MKSSEHVKHTLFPDFAFLNKKESKKTAFICDSNIISYGALFEKSFQYSEILSRKYEKDKTVITLLENNLSFLIAFLTCVLSGDLFIPLDPESTQKELKEVVFKHKDYLIIKSIKSKTASPKKNTLQIKNIEKEIKGDFSPVILLNKTRLNAPLIALKTSGVSGNPKLITRTAKSLSVQSKNFSKRINLRHEDVLFNPLPLYHSFALDTCLIPCLQKGVTYISCSKMTIHNIKNAVLLNNITIMAATPYIYDLLCRADIPKKHIQKMRLCLSAGAPLTKELSDRFYKTFGLPLVQLYGMTETGVISVNYPYKKEKALSSGKPLPHIRININKHKQTFSINGKKTEDTGYIDKDGYIFIKGRESEFINFAGKKIDPMEVEKAISSHAMVKEVTVTGKPSPKYGEVVKAFIVSSSDKLTQKNIISFCIKHLPRYKIPKEIIFLKKLPKTQTGKILRASLKKP